MINIDTAKRKEIESSLNEQAKPSVLFNHYLVYQYDFTDTFYCLGFNDFTTMKRIYEQFVDNNKIVTLVGTNSYPYEVMNDGKKKKTP